MPYVTFLREGKKIEVEEGANLRQAAMDAGISVYQGPSKVLNCLGNGLCGTCLVYVKEGRENCSEKGMIERMNLTFHPLTLLHTLGHEKEARLACQMQVHDDIVVDTRAEINLHGQDDAYERKLNGTYYVEFPDNAPRGVREKQEREEQGISKDWFHENRPVRKKETSVENSSPENEAAEEEDDSSNTEAVESADDTDE